MSRKGERVQDTCFRYYKLLIMRESYGDSQFRWNRIG